VTLRLVVELAWLWWTITWSGPFAGCVLAGIALLVGLPHRAAP
jgi:hypothetical protein